MKTKEYNDYFSKKEQLSDIANNHALKMEANFSFDIERCVNDSVIISPGDRMWYQNLPISIQSMNEEDKKDLLQIVPEIKVVDSTTVDAIYEMNKITDYVTALNFASFKNPGGKFLEGSSAQEESLCHSSILYNVLKEFKDSYYYDNRNYFLSSSLYMNRAIYTPNVLFTTLKGYEKADIITCAAPNKTSAMKYYNISEMENWSSLKNRIEFVIDIANFQTIIHHKYGSKSLILGAFGCGVFGQDPLQVAKHFLTAINNHNLVWNIFDYIVFAIPKGYNYEVFKEVFV